LVVPVGVEGQLPDEVAGVTCDDANVQVVDEQGDADSAVGGADADVVEAAVVAQGDGAAGVDGVVADPGQGAARRGRGPTVRQYRLDDELWADIARHAAAEVAKADAQIVVLCRQIGVPEHLRPSISIGWSGRGENMLASRRAELRKLAYARIDAAAPRRWQSSTTCSRSTIQHNLQQVETELIRDGLETAEAVAFVNSMPTVDQLLPPVAVGELESASPARSGSTRTETTRPPTTSES
jgi:hypothetical protein